MVSGRAPGVAWSQDDPGSREPTRVRVELAERGYDVLVGPGVRERGLAVAFLLAPAA